MTGISEEITLVKILFWPGSQASMRRKHRLGYLFSWCFTEPPPEEAEGVSPAPSTEKSAPHGSKQTGLAPRPWGSLALHPNLSSSDLSHPPVTGGVNRQPG